MAQPTKTEKIRASRKLLCNPYAHLNGEGSYDFIPHQGPLDVHESRRLSGNPYAYLDADGAFGEYIRPNHSTELVPQTLCSELLLGGKKKGDNFTKREIEKIVRTLQIELWKRRASIWPGQQNINLKDILDPSVALRVIGYRYDLCESLGQFSTGREVFEVAGIVDEFDRNVRISRRFSTDIRNFTTAHELGHAILHQATGLHRDRAQDGSSAGTQRDEVEVDADIFAAYFLMPEKPVKAAFEQQFLTSHFTINEDTAFALGFGDITALEKQYRTLRDLTKLLASTEQYNGRFFMSLAQQFSVSTEAMAIRLEELKLVSR